MLFTMAEHNELGKTGEQIAAEFLTQKGYAILAQGWRSSYLELDIVATFNNLLVIVEVKTRSNIFHGHPDDTISNKKLRQLYEAADRFIEQKQISLEVRYDLITIFKDENHFKIEHLEDAFYPFMN